MESSLYSRHDLLHADNVRPFSVEARTKYLQCGRAVSLLLVVLALVTSCRSTPEDQTSSSTPSADVRNNAASLLYDLLGDEQHVSKLLIIKRDRRELHDVISEVSSTANRARKSIEKVARNDPTLNLKSAALPAGEMQTRESESKARAHELLHSSGADFEFKLLLAQAEALAYAEHLAKVAAKNDPVPNGARAFTDISEQMSRLHANVLALLRSPPSPH